MRAEEIALKAGIGCQLKTFAGPPKSPCGMKLVFESEKKQTLEKLWTEAGLRFRTEEEN